MSHNHSSQALADAFTAFNQHSLQLEQSYRELEQRVMQLNDELAAARSERLQQLAEKDAQLRDVIAKYKDATREFESARVRARRDVANEVERGKRVILAELLDVVDNLDRAIEAGTRNAGVDALRQGVGMVRDQFLSRLAGFGVTRSRRWANASIPRVTRPPLPCPWHRTARRTAWSASSGKGTGSETRCCARPWWPWRSDRDDGQA